MASPMPQVAAKIDLRSITLYVLLTFGLTWAVDFYLLSQGVRFDHPPVWAYLTVAGTMFFPALSAVIVRLVTGQGFKRAGLRFGNWKPYVAILLGMPVLFGVIYALSWLLGVARADWGLSALLAQMAALAPGKPLPPAGVLAIALLANSLTLGMVITAVTTFGEEFGWTGFLLPHLLPLGKWRAAIIYGAIWGLWHAPIIWGGYNYPGYPIIGIFMMMIATVCFALNQTALRLRYDSVFVTSWWHAAINTQGRSIWAAVFVVGSPLLGGLMGLVGLAALGGIGAWLLARTPGK